ncbi:MAG TPA: YtxH domain-containing protein [Gaiellaceae bacterium]|nr:YtxH domain-containing protein [Gaiellaceae bacterium]
MGEDPNRIRHEIEATRAEYERDRSSAEVLADPIREARTDVNETMSALGHKADVKSRMKQSVSGKKDSLVGRVSSGKDAVVGRADSLVSTVTGVVPEKGQMVEGARKVGVSKENPMGLAIGGAAVGFLLGLLAPSTRVEDEKIGEAADQVKDAVKETGQEALERGKQVAQETVGAAKESARDSAKEQGAELSQSLNEGARDVASTRGSSQ